MDAGRDRQVEVAAATMLAKLQAAKKSSEARIERAYQLIEESDKRMDRSIVQFRRWMLGRTSPV
jgi:hypothetical protein